MKKVVLILLFAFVAMCFVFADEYVVSSYSYTDPDFGSEETVNIRYNDDDGDLFMFVISDYFSTKVLMFTKEDLESMQITAQKALEWQKTAVDNKAEVVKEIPNSKLRMIIGEIMGSSTYVGKTKVSVSFNFASIVDEDTGNVNTAMMIRSESTTDISNEFIDLDFPAQLIIDEDIQHFADAISEDTIQKAIDKHNNDVKIGNDLFN